MMTGTSLRSKLRILPGFAVITSAGLEGTFRLLKYDWNGSELQTLLGSTITGIPADNLVKEHTKMVFKLLTKGTGRYLLAFHLQDALLCGGLFKNIEGCAPLLPKRSCHFMQCFIHF